MANVEIYTKSWCPYCALAKDLLQRSGVDFTEIDVTDDAVREREMIARAGRHTVPQIFIDEHHVGGSDDLRRAETTGLLARLLAGEEKGEAA